MLKKGCGAWFDKLTMRAKPLTSLNLILSLSKDGATFRLFFSNLLVRDLMIEAGYRCAVCQSTEPLDIDHINEWSKVKEHRFENLIVLCQNCHGRKREGSKPREINALSLRKIKSP